MRLLKIYSFLLILSLSLFACEELLEPVNENLSTIDRIYIDPLFAEGLLMEAYDKIPTSGLTFNEVATDDAVTNDNSDQYRRMATGEWSNLFNPVSQWANCNSAVLYLNNFLSIIDTVKWKWSDPEMNTMFVRRLKGEAHALRGLFQYHLLVTVGGVGANGELLGIPLYDQFLEKDDNFNVPRAGFNESVDQILSDFDTSLEYLTMDDYLDISDAGDLPPGLEGVDITKYNEVFGSRTMQRISGRIVKGLKARVALLAASPAFSEGDIVKWERAANLAAVSINGIGGTTGLDPVGHRFFNADLVKVANVHLNPQKEILWRTSKNPSDGRENNNYPPSLFGSGRINPSQNLVDAFPMANGYPITDALSGYDPANPYANRDPRLSLYVVYNGSVMRGKTIKTGVGGGVNAKDSIQTSTRTGYYLRKLLREDVNMDPAVRVFQDHYEVHIRYTELFLIYAEAANEAWGPDGTGLNSFSARDVISAIRNRTGIAQPDNYLVSVNTKDAMRTLIRNERRLELCFEGFRFWDLRRWKADLTEGVKGVNINKTSTTFNYVDVEARVYNNGFMHYGPLLEKEIVKFNALVQNQGW